MLLEILGELNHRRWPAAVLSTLPVGVSCSTLEIKLNSVRPISGQTGLLRCEGKIIHAGSRIATTEGRLFDSHSTLFAHATSTCMIFRAAP